MAEMAYPHVGHRVWALRILMISIVVLNWTACFDPDALALTDSEEEVLSGYYVENDAHPWVVHLPNENCHGVLIHPEWVLTAAHCIDSSSGGVAVAPPNQPNQQSRSYIRPGKIQHPDYSPGGLFGSVPRHDIGLIHLQSPFQIGLEVQTVDLATTPLSTGETGSLASRNAYGEAVPSGMLAKFSGAVLPTCPTSTGGDHFCMTSQASGICKGDSGSGLVRSVNHDGVVRATVFGVGSFIDVDSSDQLCGQIGTAAGFADVASHRSWILSVLAIEGDDLEFNARLRINGLRSEGTLRMECQNDYQQTVWAEASMAVAGVEIGMDCGASSVIEVSCSLTGYSTARAIVGFTRTIAPSGVHELAFDSRTAEVSDYVPGLPAPRIYECDPRFHPSLYVPVVL